MNPTPAIEHAPSAAPDATARSAPSPTQKAASPLCAVDVVGLTHRFGSRVALNDVSFGVPSGELFALLGPNGGGKTTLFRILSTMLAPSGGSASVLGCDVAADPASVRRRIGVVFQSPSLDDKLTVAENLRCQGGMYGLSGRTLATRIDELLGRFDLRDRAGDRVATLSGGTRRRVEIAKALLHRPRVLLLDEPSTGLDPGHRRELLKVLLDLRERDGVTSILTTHIMDEAERCDRVGVLDRGRLVALDAPAALKAVVGREVVTLRSADPNALATRIHQELGATATAAEGEVRLEVPDADGATELLTRVLKAFGDAVESATIAKPSLEDAFIHITGRHFRADEGEAEAGQ